MPSNSRALSKLFAKWEQNTLKIADISGNEYAKTIAFTIKSLEKAPFATIASSLQLFIRASLKHPDNKDWKEFAWKPLTTPTRNYTTMDNGLLYKRKEGVCFGDRKVRVVLSFCDICVPKTQIIIIICNHVGG